MTTFKGEELAEWSECALCVLKGPVRIPPNATRRRKRRRRKARKAIKVTKNASI